MSEITLNLGGEGLEGLKEKAKGEACELKVYLTVKSNDGKTLVGTVDEIELGDEYEEEEKESKPKDGDAMIAIGMKDKDSEASE